VINRSMQSTEYRQAFVVRLWRESPDRPAWRGWVQHVATGETACFTDPTGLLAFIETYTGPLAGPVVGTTRLK
jgi:hypothetical protein